MGRGLSLVAAAVLTSAIGSVHADAPAQAVDAATRAPSLTEPAAGSSFGADVAIVYSLPETPLAGSVTLVFTPAGDGVPCTATMLDVPVASFVFSSTTFMDNSSLIASADCTELTSGTYSITLRYQNENGDPAAQTTVTGITIDNVTEPPTFGLANGVRTAGNLALDYVLPETPSSVTVTLAGTVTCLLTLTTTATTVNTVVDLANPTSNPRVMSALGCDDMPDGTYSVTLEYQDAFSNAAAAQTATGFVLDTVTESPTLTAPAVSTAYGSALPLELVWPEDATDGSVILTFAGAQTRVLTLDHTIGEVAGVISPSDLAALDVVTDVSPDLPLPDGVYTVTLRYSDDLGNPSAAVSNSNVTIDTVTASPTVGAPLGTATYGLTMPVTYTLGEATLDGGVSVVLDGDSDCTLTMSDSVEVDTEIVLDDPAASADVVSSTCSSIPSGTYTVTVSARDVLDNPATSVVRTGVRLVRAPGAPAAPTVVPGNARLAVTWAAAADPTSPTSDYVLRYRRASGAAWTEVTGPVSTSTSTTLTGLTNGTAYVVQVAAVNEWGRSGWSPSSVAATPRTTPRKPSAPTALKRNGKVVVSWTAPANGGARITDYEVQYSRNKGQWRTASDGVSTRTSATLTLRSGAYRFRVAAVNIGGRGVRSDPSASLTLR